MKTKNLKRKQKCQLGGSLKPVGSGQPSPCPICKSDQYLGIKTVWIEYPGPKRKEEKMYFCAQCGLHAQPTYVDGFISEYWNRLVRRIIDSAENATLRRDNARLAAALEKYGCHYADCEIYCELNETCTCGLRTAKSTALRDILNPTMELLKWLTTDVAMWRGHVAKVQAELSRLESLTKP